MSTLRHSLPGLGAGGLVLSALAFLSGTVHATVDPRTPIVSLPYTINLPGSYVVEKNLHGTKGITINASFVTLDLGGFNVAGEGDSTDGIVVRGDRKDIEVFNGSITGWAGRGIMAETATNSSFHDLRLSDNAQCGLRAGHAAVIDKVMAEHNGGSGVVVFEAGNVLGGSFAGNTGFGVEVGTGGVVQSASVVKNAAGGIFAGDGCRIAGNTVAGNGWLMGDASGACYIATLAGISVQGTGAFVEDNVLTANTIGLQLFGSGNAVARNMVTGPGDNYQFDPGNQLDLLLSQLPESLDWPCKVTLAGTLTGARDKHGITVNADGVTIDLAGHGLIGQGGNNNGIWTPQAHDDLVVMNGFVRGWGLSGIDATLTTDCLVTGVIADDNGWQGIRVGKTSVLNGSSAHNNLRDGLYVDADCFVTQCTSSGNHEDGIHTGQHAMITQCVASENTGYGVRTQDGSLVQGCTTSHNGFGILVGDGATVEHCTASFDTNFGIKVMAWCHVVSNTVHQTAVALIVTTGPGNRIDSNNLTSSTEGLHVYGSGNFIVRNSASNNVTNYIIADRNACGTLMNVAAANGFTVDDPWANFEFRSLTVALALAARAAAPDPARGPAPPCHPGTAPTDGRGPGRSPDNQPLVERLVQAGH